MEIKKILLVLYEENIYELSTRNCGVLYPKSETIVT